MASRTINTILNLRGNFAQNMARQTNAIKNFKKVASTVTGVLAGIGIANFAKESVALASDLDEVQNVIDTTFGKSVKAVDNWSKNAINAFGIGKLQAKQFNGTLGAMMKTAGFTGDTLAKMTTDISGLSGDIASFRNMEPAEAFEKLKSIVTGSSEPVEALGLDFRVASLEAYAMSKGIKKAYKDMSNAEQIQLRYNYTMEKTKDMQGDFAKTNKGFANQLRIFKTQISQSGANIAKYVLPYINKLIIKLNDFMNLLPKIGLKIKQVFKDFSKITSSTDFFKVFMDYINNLLFTKLPSDIATAASNIIGKIVKFFIDIYDNAVRIGKDLAEPFMGAFNSIKTFVGDRVKEIIDLINSTGDSTIVTDSFNVFRDALKEILDIIKKVFDFINSNWSTLEPIIAGVTGAVIGYKIAMQAAALWTNIVKIAQGAWAAVTGICTIAMGLLNGTLALTPLGWIVIIIGAAVAAGVALWKNWDTIKAKASEVWAAISTSFKGFFDGFMSGINKVIEKMKSLLSFKVPDWVPGIGGKEIGFKSKNIGKNALGTSYWKGGLTKLNERGGEIVDLPNGSKVIPSDKSNKMFGNITIAKLADKIVVREEADIDKIATALAKKLNATAINIA